jgi:hypothetical protein
MQNESGIARTLTEVSVYLASNGLPISHQFENSYHPKILVFYQGRPIWRLVNESGDWFRESLHDPLEITAMDWPRVMEVTELAMRISFQTLWRIVVEPPLRDIGQERNDLRDEAILNTFKYWASQCDSQVDGTQRLVAFEIIRKWDEITEELGMEQYPFLGPEWEWELDTDFRSEGPQKPTEFMIFPKIALVKGVPASLALDQASWKKIRRQSVGATDARFLVKKNGLPRRSASRILYEKITGYEMPWMEAFNRGIEREPVIARDLQDQFEHLNLRHNQMLFVGENARHVATPDMFGDGVVGEIKVSSKTLDAAYSVYHDQLQWQMHVTGARAAVFVVENRFDESREHLWVPRDQRRIDLLVAAADEMLRELDAALQQPLMKFDCVPADQVDLNPEMDPFAESESEGVRIWAEEITNTDTSHDIRSGVGLELFDSWEDFGSFAAADYSDEDIKFEWTRKRIRKLLKRYLAGEDIYKAAEVLEIEPAVAMYKLASLVLDPVGPLIDESAKNFGNTWTGSDFKKLDRMWKMNENLKSIADRLGRDQLGAAFVIFARHSPKIPIDVIQEFKV